MEEDGGADNLSGHTDETNDKLADFFLKVISTSGK